MKSQQHVENKCNLNYSILDGMEILKVVKIGNRHGRITWQLKSQAQGNKQELLVLSAWARDERVSSQNATTSSPCPFFEFFTTSLTKPPISNEIWVILQHFLIKGKKIQYKIMTKIFSHSFKAYKHNFWTKITIKDKIY